MNARIFNAPYGGNIRDSILPRRRRKTLALLALALFALIGPDASRTAFAQSYLVQDLNTVPTSVDSVAVSISNFAGVLVGNGDMAAQLGNEPTLQAPYAFWSLGGGPMNLFSAPNGYSTPYVRAINGLNVVGEVRDAAGYQWATLWINANAPTVLPNPYFGSSDSVANGVNLYGKVVGWRFNPAAKVQVAYMWDSKNGYWFLGWDILGGAGSAALAINKNNWIVGSATIADNLHFHAFLWIDKVTTDLHDSNLFGGNSSEARAINDSGNVVGWANKSNGFKHAFLNYLSSFFGKRTMADLGTLPGYIQSNAYGINNGGKVVGWSGNTFTETDGHAFLYDGILKDLNAHILANSGWVLQAAYGINDAGKIVGWGMHNGKPHAFLLTPQ